MRESKREYIRRNVTLSYCLRQTQTLLHYTPKILRINGSQTTHFKFLYKEKYSQIFQKLTTKLSGAFLKDAVYTVPQMLVSVSGGCRAISSHRPY